MGLVEEFERAARAVAATVERLPRSADRLAESVRRAAPDALRIAIAEPRDLPGELFAAFRRMPGALTGRSKQELESCDVGITEAFAGVARTGSVCVAVDEGYAGYISLLARTHIVVLLAETIVARPADLVRAGGVGGKGLERNFVFVTGPSATADMGPLVRGVHGPHRLHILLLE